MATILTDDDSNKSRSRVEAGKNGNNIFEIWGGGGEMNVVGDSRFELETPVLSGLCSNQLS